jgi:hypothetical protein
MSGYDPTVILSLILHVKWFAPFDVKAMPKPIGEVLNGTFINSFWLQSRSSSASFWPIGRCIGAESCAPLMRRLKAARRFFDSYSSSQRGNLFRSSLGLAPGLRHGVLRHSLN